MDTSNERKKFWRTQIKHRGIEALGGKCVICGGIFDDCCYDFHHLIPQEKDFTISSSNTNGARSWIKIRDELKKCALLCANCHRRYHSGLVTLDSTKQYFNDDYYEWDLCEVRAINSQTNEPIIKNVNALICPICGGYKQAKSKECQACSRKSQHRYEVSREELKNLIYTQSFTAIGEKFGVTDNAIRKKCIAYGLPSKKRDIKKYSEEEWNKI